MRRSYPKYKHSSIPWLKEIPNHWSERRFKFVTTPSTKTNNDGMARPMLSLSAYNGIQEKSYEHESAKRAIEDSQTYNVVNRNQLVVNPMWIIQGSIGVSFIDVEGIVSPAYRIYNLKKEFHPKFCDYLLRSNFYVKEYNCYIRGLTTYDRSVRKEEFHDILVILPPIEEQIAIVNYLDRRCKKIDQVIEGKKKLIEKYREKINVIVQAAKGKNSATSKFWPHITDSWELKKAKWIFKEVNNKNHPGEELLAATQDRGVIPKSMCNEDFVSPSGDYNNLKLVTENDYVISLRSFQGGIEHSAYRGVISPAYTVIRLQRQYNHELYNRYFKYLFKTPQLISLLNTAISGIRDGKNINWTDFCDLPLPIPPIKHIEKMQVDFDRHEHLVTIFESEKKMLTEYKTTLISDAVTGRIDVRSAKSKEYKIQDFPIALAAED